MTTRIFCLTLALAACLAAFGAAPAQAQGDDGIRTTEYPVDDITYPDLRDFEVPTPRRVTLDNGLTVFLLEDRELPQVSAVARIGTGSVYEPAEKVGLASVTGAAMRTGGTASMTPDEVNELLEGLGASVETGIGSTSGYVFMNTLKEHVGEVLPVFAEILRTPAFAEDKVALAKTQQKSAIARRNDNPQQIAFREFDKLVYGADSPYARTPEYFTVDAIVRDDVVGFHERFFHPNNTLISVYGDFDADAMAKRLEAAFGDWPAAEGAQRPAPPPVEGERDDSVHFIPKDDVTQSTVMIGHVGEIRRDHPDYFATIVMNEVLSGGFTSRLFQSVRTDQGLAYTVGGRYSAGYETPGTFLAYTFTKSETTIKAVDAIMAELEKLREAPPTEEEMQLAKDSYLNSFVFNFDTKREVANRLMAYAYYDYPSDFLQQTKAGIEAVTAEDVQRVARTYMHPDEATILVLGKADDFDQPVSALTRDGGTVDTIDIAIPTEAPGMAEAEVDAEEMALGMEKLMAARDALGGAAFADVEGMTVRSTAETQQMGTVTSTQHIDLGDGRLRSTLSLAMGEITIVGDGDAMMMKSPQGTQPMPPSQRENISAQQWRDVAYLMAKLPAEGLEAQYVGEETNEGGTFEVVKVTPPAGSPFMLYLDAATLRPARLVATVQTPQGPQEQVTLFDDYREVDGLTLPFSTTTLLDGTEVSSSTTEEIVLNPDFEAGFFTLGDS